MNKTKLIKLTEWIKDTFKYGMNIETINTLLRYIPTIQTTMYTTHGTYFVLKIKVLLLVVAAEYIVPRDSDITTQNKNKIYRMYWHLSLNP